MNRRIRNVMLALLAFAAGGAAQSGRLDLKGWYTAAEAGGCGQPLTKTCVCLTFEPAVSGQPLILVAKALPQAPIQEPLVVTVRITQRGQNERCFVRAASLNEPDDGKVHLYLSALLYTNDGWGADRLVLARSEVKQGVLSKVFIEPVP